MRTDIFIPLGSGSKFQDVELQYSLRSIEKFGRNVGKIFVVGNMPGFKLSSLVEHISFRDDMTEPKQSRIATKTDFFFRHTGVNSAVQWNDDYILTKSTDVSLLHAYSDGSLADKIARQSKANLYTVALQLTEKHLQLKGIKNPTHFDLHLPTIFTKKGWENCSDTFKASRCCPTGFVVRTCYHNINKDESPLDIVTDSKVKSTKEFDEMITKNDRWCFSFGDGALQTSEAGLLKFLHEKFPKKSRYEA